MGLLESLDGQPPAGVGWEFDGSVGIFDGYGW